MSGGSYDYAYSRIARLADEIEENISANLSQATKILRRRFAEHLRLVAKAAHDIEWVDSSDYGPNDEIDSINRVLGYP